MIRKVSLKRTVWILLEIVFSVVSISLFVRFGCYYLDRRSFISPIKYDGDNVPIRHDAYGKGDFGAKRNGRRMHLGVDILAPIGAPVYAARCGLVINAEKNRGLGNYVEILHRGGLVTIYAHLSQIDVFQGQRVCQGQKIGEVGKTGNARNRLILAHLHFEVRKFGVPQDPMIYIPVKRRSTGLSLSDVSLASAVGLSEAGPKPR